MKEMQGNVWCVMSFGKDWHAAHADAVARGEIPMDVTFEGASNPMPTGDHWKVIAWALQYIKQGKACLTKIPANKRGFAKQAGEILMKGSNVGFRMSVSSVAARKYRDDNDLRMARGTVFLFVGRTAMEEPEAR